MEGRKKGRNSGWDVRGQGRTGTAQGRNRVREAGIGDDGGGYRGKEKEGEGKKIVVGRGEQGREIVFMTE